MAKLKATTAPELTKEDESTYTLPAIRNPLLEGQTVVVFGDFKEKASTLEKARTLGAKIRTSKTADENSMYISNDVTSIPTSALNKTVYSFEYINKLMDAVSHDEVSKDDYLLTIEAGLENRINVASEIVATALAAQGESKNIRSKQVSGPTFDLESNKILDKDGNVVQLSDSIFSLNYDVLSELPEIEIPPPMPRSKNDPDTRSRGSSKKFTPFEDAQILQLVRRYPHLRGTHTFYQRLSLLPALAMHTGNSIRFRFRKVLSKKLDFVYEVDPKTNQVQFDKDNNPIKNYGDSNLLKSQYTAEEDYALCKAVDMYRTSVAEAPQTGPAGRRKLEIIPESVFRQVTESAPRHSVMSYRDRYRKFASVFGIKEYIQYYDDCIATEATPMPMKNLSSRQRRTKRAREEAASIAGLTGATEELLKQALSKVEENGSVPSAADPEAPETKKAKKPSIKSSVTKEKVIKSESKQIASEPTNIFELEEEAQKALLMDLSERSAAPPLEDISPIYDQQKATVEEVEKYEFPKFDEKNKVTALAEISYNLGFSSEWLHSWFNCVSGNAAVLKEVLLNYLTTEKVQLYNDSRFWSAESDLLLADTEKNKDQLHELYTDEQIEARKKYLSSLEA